MSNRIKSIQPQSDNANGVAPKADDIQSLAASAAEVRKTLTGLSEGMLLTEQDVSQAAAFVTLLQEQQNRLNRIAAELNKLPSSWDAQYAKPNPNGHRRY